MLAELKRYDDRDRAGYLIGGMTVPYEKTNTKPHLDDVFVLGGPKAFGADLYRASYINSMAAKYKLGGSGDGRATHALKEIVRRDLAVVSAAPTNPGTWALKFDKTLAYKFVDASLIRKDVRVILRHHT
jgi:hypothetical protein